MKTLTYFIGLFVLVWAALLTFTAGAQALLPALLEPLFRATAGNPDILAALWGGSVVIVLLALLRTRHRR